VIRVAVDSSVLVASLNVRDSLHEQALILEEALAVPVVQLTFFDCVVAESISVLTRRLHEKGRHGDLGDLLDDLAERVPVDEITWVLPDVREFYNDVIGLIRASSGALNFNDALIALNCQRRGIYALASFDADFDRVQWLKRLTAPGEVTSMLQVLARHKPAP